MTSSRRIFYTALMAAGSLLGSAAIGQEAPIAPSTPIVFEPCHIKAVEELAKCGSLDVPENHNQPDGKKISLNITILPPSGGQPTNEPLYFLAGGPGQAATEQGVLYDRLMRRIRRGRDLILVDQRGTGKSNPFSCVASDDPLASGATIARACLEADQQSDTPHDPTQYTSDAFVKDLDLVRQALGHEQISLLGISYGTRAALLYAKAHEQHVRAMILDSVAPPHVPIYQNDAEFSGNVLTKTIKACQDDTDCGNQFPNIDQKLIQVLDRLTQTPETIIVPEANDLTLTITSDMFLTGFRGALYSPPSARLIPYIISQAHDGDFASWLALADFGNQELSGGISLGLLISVQCAEELPLLQGENAPQSVGLFPSSYALFWKEACDIWPQGSVPADFNAPVKVSTPTLLISGGLDPITPATLGDAAAEHLPVSRHIVVPFAGHSVIAYGCTNRLYADFLDTADPQSIDAACLDKIKGPAFLVGRFGPRP